MFAKLGSTSERRLHETSEMAKNWTLVQLFNLYRVSLALILAGIYFFYFAQVNGISIVYLMTVLIYILLGMTSIIVTHKRLFDVEHQTIAQVFLDIFILFLLMEANPEMIYFYGILINAAIAAGSIIVAGRISLLFAAMASIAVLLQFALMDSKEAMSKISYTRIGVLGTTFFVTAILAYALSRRIRSSEALARQRGVDLAKLSKLNEAIIQRITSGIIVVDEQEQVHFTNEMAKQLLDQEKPQGHLRDISIGLYDQLQTWRTHHQNFSNNMSIKNSKKSLIARFVALGDPAESKYAVLIFLEDGVRLAQQAQQMKLASLGRLTASIAHEIRNPLGAICHAGQLLQESKALSAQENRLSEIICQQSLRMNQVVENVLRLSKHKPLSPSMLMLKRWLSTFIQQYQQQKNANIRLSVHPDDLAIFIDETQLRQVLTNLFDNGLNYSQENTGEPSIDVIVTQAPKSENIMIDIIDHGTGIDESISDQIFEPFFTTKENGTGLGLYIAKELCEANQASLYYQPCTEGGSCFKIVFNNREGY
jgi:two-component system, NtrC family, sensor histidine kinase PilS